ncbi:hypothetical protein [Streptomyces alanosinicus]|uniref:DUF4190 domain-containing protein n=1 Tax=Streptomyces alanosinicus TaxID=68171 RepID=A0A918YL13_9ACTN|nr:hypothetical protein [Streptomyces alanosinicus]GHE05892.1 hypothetical protein GCM10010339_43750 [Streptomyces alanosinicus]
MSRSTAAAGADSPATLLGPTAFGLGLAAVAGICPWFFFGMLPVMLICGALALTLGLAGIHYAQRGIGRLWMTVTGTVLGAIGFVWPFVIFLPLFW